MLMRCGLRAHACCPAGANGGGGAAGGAAPGGAGTGNGAGDAGDAGQRGDGNGDSAGLSCTPEGKFSKNNYARIAPEISTGEPVLLLYERFLEGAEVAFDPAHPPPTITIKTGARFLRPFNRLIMDHRPCTFRHLPAVKAYAARFRDIMHRHVPSATLEKNITLLKQHRVKALQLRYQKDWTRATPWFYVSVF